MEQTIPTNGDAPNGAIGPKQDDPAPPPAINIRRLGAFEDFMETGDLPTPISATASQRAAIQRAAFSPTTPSPASVPAPSPEVSDPPAPAAPTPAPAAVSSSPARSAPVSAPAPAGPGDPADSGSFLTGLFRKAAVTLESTLESAKRDIARNPVISTAQEGLAELSNAFMSESTDLTTLGARAVDPLTAEGDARPAAPAKTAALRPLKLNHATGAEPVMLFVGGPARDVFVVTETSVEAFAWDGPKILQHNLSDTWGADTSESPVPSPAAGGSPPRRGRGARGNSRAPDDVVPVRAATHVPAGEEVVVGLADGSLRVLSVRSGQMGEQLRSTPAAQTGTAQPVVSALCGHPTGALVGREDGSLAAFKLDTLASAASMSPPAMSATPLAAETRYPPVTCIDAGQSGAPLEARVAVGYADGTVAVRKFSDPAGGVAFAVHAGGVTGVRLMFGGAVVVSIGGEEDPSLCATVAATGRCVLRRMLPYTPMSLCGIPDAPMPPSANAPAGAAIAQTPAPAATGASGGSSHPCPSEGALIVGGADGELDVFRLVALSAHNLEFRLLRRISERTRGRRRAIVMSAYSREDGLLLALSRAGEVRRWRLSASDASLLSLPATSREQYSASNVRAALGGARTDAEETRLAVGEGVIAAQRVLAGVLEDDVGVDEAGKDALVEQFQRMQAEMQDTASQNDGELRRARLRIARRFAGVVEPAPPASDAEEKAIAQAALRCAALELNAACNRHATKLAAIRATTVQQLRVVLLQSLRGATGAPERVGTIRRAAEDLAQISPEA